MILPISNQATPYVRLLAGTAFSLQLCILFLVFTPELAFSANSPKIENDSIKNSDNKLFALPVIFYTPETRFAFGGAGIYTFRFKNQSDSAQSSQIQLGLVYTLNKQLLAYLPFQIFWQEDNYRSYGEIGFYKYTYFFYGIGASHQSKQEETYDVNYPRVRLNFLKQIWSDLYFGLRYWFEDYRITEIDPDGQLARQPITGKKGGITSGLGLVANYDSRDNVFFPARGAFIEMAVHPTSSIFGSDFNYTRFLVDAAKYFENKWAHVLALNFYGEFMGGDPPFNQLALLGGTKRMRGFIEGQYRDKNMLIFQTEYRAPVIWRIGVVAFAGYGGVADKISNFDLRNFKVSYGGGLRFLLDTTRKLNIRFDVGITKTDVRYYLTFGEAF